jgi:hypothetical protein
VAEAREVMLRLADAIKRPIEDALAIPAAPPPPPPPAPSLAPLIGLGVGLLAVAGGSALIFAADMNDKTMPALGGALVGAGLAVVGISIHTLATDPARGRRPAVGVTVAWRW